MNSKLKIHEAYKYEMFQLSFCGAPLWNTSFCFAIADDLQPVQLFTFEFIQPFPLLSVFKCIIHFLLPFDLVLFLFYNLLRILYFRAASAHSGLLHSLWCGLIVVYSTHQSQEGSHVWELSSTKLCPLQKKGLSNALRHVLLFYLSLISR